MDDLGNILYVIFMIVAIIFSIVRKSNKNAKDSSMPKPHPDRNDPFEDVLPDFGELFGNKPLPKKVADASIEKSVKEAESLPKHNRIKERKGKVEGNTYINRGKEDLRDNLSINKNEVEVQNNVDWFDARKAIIYSEILKRPDY